MAQKTKALVKAKKSPATKIQDRYREDPLIRLAVEKDFSIERMQQLIEMRDREDAKNAKKAFELNFALMQAEINVILRNKAANKPLKRGDEIIGTEEMYSYSTIGMAKKQIQESMTKYGFAFRWKDRKTDWEKHRCSINFYLSGWGHTEITPAEGQMLQPTNRQNALQALEGTFTYLKRYSMWDGLGLASDDDDRDGAGKTYEDDPQDGPKRKTSKAYMEAMEALRNKFAEMSESRLFGSLELDKYEQDARRISHDGDAGKVNELVKAWDADIKTRVAKNKSGRK